MESSFPRDEGRFKVLPTEREYDLICNDIDTAVRHGWDVRLGGLYGVVRRRRRKGQPKLPGKRTVHVPSKCEIPRGYGTIKSKSWRLQVIKGRPITPHTKHVLRKISRTSARGYHVVLTTINGERVSRMFTTQEYKVRLRQDYEQALEGLLREVPGACESDLGMAHIM